MDSASYATVTELPGVRATAEQLRMLMTRYELARRHCRGKEALEIACGSGMGLGYLAREAQRVIGGDIDERVLAHARKHYDGRDKIKVLKMDAQELPLHNNTLDTVVLYEAIYYLTDPARFLREAIRVLRPGGTLVLCSVNCEWQGFNPSPFSVRYFTAGQLRLLLHEAGFEPRLYGAFPDSPDSVRRRVIARIRRWAVRFRLIPQTMRGKELLKRIFYGQLAPLGPELREGLATPAALTDLPDGTAADQFKVLYAVATSLKSSAMRSAAA